MKTGIVIPCYNEENRLDITAFLNVISQENKYHLCFVNDGSTDNTISILKNLQEANPYRVSIIDVKKNVGKASAVRAGARYFYNRSDIAFIGFIDADLSTDFEDFAGLLRTLETDRTLSFVFGSRAKSASGTIEKDVVRSFISRIINILIVAILGLSIQDTQCGAKVFKASLVPILFAQSFFSRWLFDVELFLKMKRHFGKHEVMNKIYEQPLKRWLHMEDSKLGIRDALEIPFRLLSIWFHYNVLQTISTATPTLTIAPTTPLVIEIYETPTTAFAA